MNSTYHEYRSDLNGLQILVVDDDIIMHDIIEGMLSQDGAQTIKAENGQQALDILREMNSPAVHVVIMDMNGIEATRQIRNQLGLHSLPIIACSSELLLHIWRDLQMAGFNDFLPKPINSDDLIQTLRHWIKNAKPGTRPSTPKDGAFS